MTRRTIGIVDYGVGNHASVWRALHALGYRCRVSSDVNVLGASNLLLLPGVGAFPPAMQALHRHGLSGFLQEQARMGRPFVGICLGMQLLADGSSEFGQTAGLGLIPGLVTPLVQASWHTGWNSIEAVGTDPLLRCVDGEPVYFNHSYVFEAPAEYRIGVARLREPLTIAVRRGNIVGLQFHPEKSQAAGRAILRSVIEGLCDA